MGDVQVQAAVVWCVVCEAAPDLEVCMVFNAVPGLEWKRYVLACSELLAASDGRGPSLPPSATVAPLSQCCLCASCSLAFGTIY